MIVFLYLQHLVLVPVLSREDRTQTHLVSAKKDIEVTGQGMLPVEFGDVGFALYVTIANIGDSQLQVSTRMVECCEVFYDEQSDCTFMQLMGGNLGYISPKETRNATLLYPNMYPFNRRGDCVVSIWYKDRYNSTDEIRTSVQFNTYPGTLRDPSPYEYHSKKAKDCRGNDLDPYNNCLPVDCHQKYNGQKTFFSRLRKRCLMAPACYADPNKNLPDVAYLPVSNTCRDLDNPISDEDVRYLSKLGLKSKIFKHDDSQVNWSELNINVRCHHGELSNKTGLCICDKGWTSAMPKDNFLLSSTLLYHMCTIKKSYLKLFNFNVLASRFYHNGSKVMVAALGLNILAMIILCLCFPSIEPSYMSALRDDETSDTKEHCDSDCSSKTGHLPSTYSSDSVETCFLLMDKTGNSLYTAPIANNIYKQVIKEVTRDYSRTNMNLDSFQTKNLEALSSDSSDCIIQTDKSSGLEENLYDLLGLSDSEWEEDNIKPNIPQQNEKILLQDYIGLTDAKRSSETGINLPPAIEESSGVMEVHSNLQSAKKYCELSQQLSALLYSSSLSIQNKN